MKTRTLSIVCIALVSLSACDRPVTREEARDIAEDSATDTSALESRFSELEEKVERLEREQSKDISVLAEITRADMNDGREISAELKRLSNNDEAFIEQINYLRALQGRPPMTEK